MGTSWFRGGRLDRDATGAVSVAAFNHFETTPSISTRAIGFEIWSFMPAARQRSI
jgi:hypothetical protein